MHSVGAVFQAVQRARTLGCMAGRYMAMRRQAGNRARRGACPGARRHGSFGHPHAVGFGGIEAIDAIIDRRLNGVRELALVDPAVGAADFPAPEADCRDLEVRLAKSPIFHALPHRLAVRGSRLSAPHSAASQLRREVTRCRILGQTDDQRAADVATCCSRGLRDHLDETKHPPPQGSEAEKVNVRSPTPAVRNARRDRLNWVQAV